MTKKDVPQQSRDRVWEKYDLKIDALRPVHYLGKVYKTIFVGAGEIHKVEAL